MRVGRPNKIRIAKRQRTKVFGNQARRGAMRANQIRAAMKRESVRPRTTWARSRYRKKRYG